MTRRRTLPHVADLRPPPRRPSLLPHGLRRLPASDRGPGCPRGSPWCLFGGLGACARFSGSTGSRQTGMALYGRGVDAPVGNERPDRDSQSAGAPASRWWQCALALGEWLSGRRLRRCRLLPESFACPLPGNAEDPANIAPGCTRVVSDRDRPGESGPRAVDVFLSRPDLAQPVDGLLSCCQRVSRSDLGLWHLEILARRNGPRGFGRRSRLPSCFGSALLSVHNATS